VRQGSGRPPASPVFAVCKKTERLVSQRWAQNQLRITVGVAHLTVGAIWVDALATVSLRLPGG